MKNPGSWNALAGAFLFLIWVIFFQGSGIDLVLGFAFLVLVPLLLEEAVQSAEGSRPEKWLWNVMSCSLPFSAAGMIAISLPSGNEAGWWAAVWFFYTLLIAFGGFMRLLSRGLGPVEETVIDVGLIYIAIGGGWLVCSSAGWTGIFPYSETILQLNVVHYHYAAFVVPLVTGFFGRYRAECNRIRKNFMVTPYLWLAVGVMAGSFITGPGLSLGAPFTSIAAGVYFLVLVWLCLWWFWLSVYFKLWIGMALRAASLLLLGTMLLALFTSLSIWLEVYWLQLNTIAGYHGLWIASVFSILSALAWRGVHAPQRHAYTVFPISHIRAGRGSINPTIDYKPWAASHEYVTGLVHDWSPFNSPHFHSEHMDSLVKRWFLHTDNFHVQASIQWARGFRSIADRISQWGLPPSGSVALQGEAISISDYKDGRNLVRAWITRNKQTKEPLNTALYSFHEHAGETYFNIGFPVPHGVLTVIGRVETDGTGGVMLETMRREDGRGDEGIYFTLGEWTMRLPVRGMFHVKKAETVGDLLGDLCLRLGYINLLHIQYQMKEIRVV
ncbi:YndJ family protein [Halobacillus sp. B29]|uniref:YndJ family protein n=1 Tax=Halobacillus sp. B29 TaxID=3457432 RepID=UPI003FCCB907